METQRLDKILVSRGFGSRRDVQKLIRQGAVTLNGEVCRLPETKADPKSDRLEVRGQAVGTDEYIYIMMNKPAGVVSATEDKRDRTVLDLLPPELRRPGLFPAGRLDKDTEGLLIITNDGELAHRMLSPKKHVEKRYLATLDKPVTPEMIDAFGRGIVFADGTKCMPARLKAAENAQYNVAEVSIFEGKFHQVKKMFSVCGCKVVHLQRISVGSLYLDGNLPIGSCKLLTKLDIDAVFIGNIH